MSAHRHKQNWGMEATNGAFSWTPFTRVDFTTLGVVCRFAFFSTMERS